MIKCKLGLLLISICLVTFVESQESDSVTEAPLSAETLPETTETATEPLIDGIDGVATAEESSDTIKPQNRDKCDKCLKMSFRYRHGNFCSKCVSNNLLDVDEQNKLDNVVRCKKCKKLKFRTRHTLFCSATCPSSTPVTQRTSSTTTSTMPTTSRSTTAEQFLSNDIFSDEDMSKEDRRKFKHQRREERRRERERRRNDKNKKPVKETKLGPLGTFLKSIIVANTFVD